MDEMMELQRVYDSNGGKLDEDFEKVFRDIMQDLRRLEFERDERVRERAEKA